LPASAAQEPPPTPNSTSQTTALPTTSTSLAGGVTGPAVSVYHNTVMSAQPGMMSPGQSTMVSPGQPGMVSPGQQPNNGSLYSPGLVSPPGSQQGVPTSLYSHTVPSPDHHALSPTSGHYTEMNGHIDSVFSPFNGGQNSLQSYMDVSKPEVKVETYGQQGTTVNVFPPMANNSDSNDFFDLNDVINNDDLNGDLNPMDWTSDTGFGDLDLTDTGGMGGGMMELRQAGDQSSLSIPVPPSPQRSMHGSEPDLANLGLCDMDTHTNMQIDVPDWLDVIMPATGFTPVSANAPVSFPADPILTPQTQKEVLDLFNFDESDLNTPSDFNCGSVWDKLTETTS